MGKINCLIIDDESDARYMLANLLSDFSDLDIIDQCSSVDQAIESYSNHQPQVIFLDIKMPKQDGFSFLDKLNELKENPIIVFSTAYDEYAIKALRSEAFDYLLKPVDPKELKAVIQRIRLKLPKEKNNVDSSEKIRINTRTGYLLIPQEEIVFLKADGNYTQIVIDKGQQEVSSFHLGKIEKQLSKDAFLRLGRSIVLNTRYLYKVDRNKNRCILRKGNHNYEVTIPDHHLIHLERII